MREQTVETERDPWAFIRPEIERAIERGREKGYTDDEIEKRLLDALPDAMEQAFESMTEELYRTLTKTRRRMLREHRRAQKSFEKRLHRRWGRALDLYYACYVACQEAGSMFNETYRSAAAAENDVRFEALCHLHARACTTSSEVYSLLRTGHAAGALARWRTIHEIAVVAYLLGDADRDLSERFLLHTLVEDYKDALEYQRFCERLGYEAHTDDEMTSFREASEAVCSRFAGLYERDWGWAEPLIPDGERLRFSTLESLVNLDHHRPFYRWANHGTHSGSKGARLNIAELPAGGVFLAGPSNAGLADPGQGTLIALLQVTICFLIRGRGQGAMGPMTVPTLRVLERMCEDAGEAFLGAHEELERATEEYGVHVQQ